MSDADLWLGLEGHRGRVEQVRENSARPARMTARYTTNGLGSFAEEAEFAFDMAFLDMPTFNFGCALGDGVELPDVLTDYPVGYAGVTQWKVTGDGLYVGAWCHFVVTGGATVNPATFSMDFLLSWFGVAGKNFIASRNFPVNALEI